MKNYTTSEKIFCEKVLKRALRKLPNYNEDKMIIKPDTKIRENLNLDSLDIVQTLLTLEHKYNITINFNNVSDFQTVNDVYKSVITALTNKNREIAVLQNTQKR